MPSKARKDKDMYFALDYDKGYIVTCTKVYRDGFYATRPLRKFICQGDAMIYKEVDCSKLTDIQIELMAKRYNPENKYLRTNKGKLIKL